MKYYGWLILFLTVLMLPQVSFAQEQSGAADSLRQQNDSLVMVLRSQVQVRLIQDMEADSRGEESGGKFGRGFVEVK